MLKLVNIVKNNNRIEADYIPENSSKKAHISLDTDTHEYSAENIEEYGEIYGRMAANGLIRTLNELEKNKISSIPKERLVMWY